MLSKFESLRALVSSDLAKAELEPSTQLSGQGAPVTSQGSFELSTDTFSGEGINETVRQFRQAAVNAGSLLWQHDFLADWRELKLEREV